MSHSPVQIALESCTVDLVRGTVARSDGSTAQLTTREAALLQYLVLRPGQEVSRDQLIREVWGFSDHVVTRACDNAVRRLRTKIEANASQPRHLLTVHGTGYRFVPLEIAGLAGPGPAAPASEGIEEERTPPVSEPLLVLGDVVVDLGRHRARSPSGEVELSSQDVKLLRVLLEANGQVVDRPTLYRRVWGHQREANPDSRAVDNAIRRLRTKIETKGSDAGSAEWRFLLTARSGGYRLVVPSARAVEDGREALIGRDEDLAAVQQALQDARWVVLTGPGGVGKTRLARRLASERSPTLWVDLTSCSDGAEMDAAVAAVLDMALPAEGAVDRLGRALASRGSGLLVLDNLEALVEPAAQRIGTWLSLAPELQILGTSRVRLGLDGEVALELGPLPPEQALELFLHRARAVCRTARLELDPALRTLVERLDGLPLAIELAAARMPAMTPSQLLERLDRASGPLDLLHRPRAENARHRSIRSVVASSWELLTDEQQQAMMLLSRFRRGFTLEDAEGLLGEDAIDLLQALRDHSLVHNRPFPDGASEEPVFGIYETLRAFSDEARSSLPDGGRALDLAFARWMARLGEPARLLNLGLERARREARQQRQAVDDLELASELALAWGDLPLAARAVLGAAPGRVQYGPSLEVALRLQRIFEALRAEASDQPAARLDLIRLQAAWALVLRTLDRPAEALPLAREAWTAALALQPPFAEGVVLAGRVLSSCLADLDKIPEFLEVLDVLAEACEALGRSDLAEWSRARAALRREQGAEAYAHYERAAELAHRMGDRLLAAKATCQLGNFDLVNGRPGLARRRLEESLSIHLQEGAPVETAGIGQHLLSTLVILGEAEDLERRGEELLALSEQTGSLVDTAVTWAYLAAGRVHRGQIEAAREALAQCRAALDACPRDAPRTRGFAEMREAELMMLQGDGGSACQLALSARARFASINDDWNMARADGVLARALTMTGRAAEGLERGDQAVRYLLEHNAGRHALPVCLAQRGQAALAAGQRDRAEQDLAQAVEVAARLGLSGPHSEPQQEIARLREALAAHHKLGFAPGGSAG